MKMDFRRNRVPDKIFQVTVTEMHKCGGNTEVYLFRAESSNHSMNLTRVEFNRRHGWVSSKFVKMDKPVMVTLEEAARGVGIPDGATVIPIGDIKLKLQEIKAGQTALL